MVVEMLLAIIAAGFAIAFKKLKAVGAALRTFKVVVCWRGVIHGNGLNNCMELTAGSVLVAFGATRRR